MAQKKAKKTNPVVLKAGMLIGGNAAEYDDEYLIPCFVQYPPVELALDLESRGTIISGRTGSGKTAILRYILYKEDNVTEIEPSDMSMSYISNSDVMHFLNAIGADLDLLFQTLWKHVLCIEFIRLKFSIKNEDNSKNLYNRLKERFRRDARKDRALNYLRNWEGKFWISMDVNIKELTEKIENAVKAEMGGEVEKFKAGGQYDKRISADKKTEYIHRVKKIINSDQLAELNSVVELLSEVIDDDKFSKYYVLIDRLDENWVDASIRFKLIRSLLESLKSFRKIRPLKILVTMRPDVLERVVQETKDLTFQREKYDDYFINIKWNKVLLRQLVELRIQSLFRKQYSQSVITFSDVFSHRVSNSDPLDYILERTLLRPRDVIAFVNQCIKSSEGTYEITGSTIKKAELEFSRIRRDSLEQEWQSAFPSIKNILDYIGKYQKPAITIDELQFPDHLQELTFQICSEKKIGHDPIYDNAKSYFDDNSINSRVIVNQIIEIVYRIGAVGVKMKNGDSFIYSHIDQPLVQSIQFTQETRVRIHPMLWGAFRLNPPES